MVTHKCQGTASILSFELVCVLFRLLACDVGLIFNPVFTFEITHCFYLVIIIKEMSFSPLV